VIDIDAVGDGVNVPEAFNAQADKKTASSVERSMGVKGTLEIQEWAAVGVQEHGMW